MSPWYSVRNTPVFLLSPHSLRESCLSNPTLRINLITVEMTPTFTYRDSTILITRNQPTNLEGLERSTIVKP